MTANRKGVKLKYAVATFSEAKACGDLNRMQDMFNVVVELWRVRNRKITMLKTKIKSLKKGKIEVDLL